MEMITSRIQNGEQSMKSSGKSTHRVGITAGTSKKIFCDNEYFDDGFDSSANNGYLTNVFISSGQTDKQVIDGQYGVDKFRSSWDMFLSSPNDSSHPSQHSLHPSSARGSTRSRDHPSKMVLAFDSVAETVAVVPKPNLTETSVYSQLEISDHRRHKEQVIFRPVLHPVKYADTAYVYINSTKKRFVSRTYYEPRVRPRTFSDTTYNNPKIAEERYVSYLDYGHEKRRWFKTSVEIKGRKVSSCQISRSANNNFLQSATKTTTTTSVRSPGSSGYESSRIPNGMSAEDFVAKGQGRGAFRERFDPGASQVFIPKQRPATLNEQSLINGDIVVDFPNSQVDIDTKGPDIVEEVNVDFSSESQVNTEEFSEFSLALDQNESTVTEESSEFKFDLSEEVNIDAPVVSEEFAEFKFDLSEETTVNETEVTEEFSEVRFDLTEEVNTNQTDVSEEFAEVNFDLAQDVDENVTIDFSEEAVFEVPDNKVDINMNDTEDVSAEATFSLA